MKFQIGDETDTALCVALHHEFLRCHDHSRSFKRMLLTPSLSVIITGCRLRPSTPIRPTSRPVKVVDPNNGSTTFVYDGFGDVIQRISPDTGRTVYHYDSAGNLVQSVDARGAIANSTYDALNRSVTATYPADAAENVAYTYDQAGHGFGVGRLTGVTDAAGALSRSYDERGNLPTSQIQNRFNSTARGSGGL